MNDCVLLNLIFFNGLDVFGRDVWCCVCYVLVNVFNENFILFIVVECVKLVF